MINNFYFERTFIVFVKNITVMKTSILVKLHFIFPIILIADYILMAIIGSTACLFGCGDSFYCGAYCIIGKIVLGLSALYFGYLIYPDIATLYKNHKNAATAEK